MNIILDASLLGIGFYHRQAQTGVGRVVEQLVNGLHQADGIDLMVAAPTHLPETMRYAQSLPGLSTLPFANRPTEQRMARVENAVLSPFGVGSLPAKGLREGFYRTRKVLHADVAQLKPETWPSGSIYHSPFYPIPEVVGKDKSVRTVQMIHDLIPIFHPEWFPNSDDTIRQVLVYLPTDALVVTPSKATKDDFCNYTGTDPARVMPIHLAASPTLFYPLQDEVQKRAVRQQYGLGDAPYLLSLATLEPRKNTDHLIRCFVQLAGSGDIPADTKLVLVGTKGWKMEKIMAELTRNQTLRSRLVVTGFVPDEHLAPLYSDALGFVYPSLAEGFGLPPLEAMQCGLPVITSTIPSIAEVVADAAISVSPTDTDALCQAMLTVVNSSTVRANLSAKAIERASLFSWDKFIREHVALYRELGYSVG